MHCPGFDIFSYGIFDSRVAYPKLSRTNPRLLSRFELELITEDLGGISYFNQTSYPLEKNLFLCGKPGQHRCSQLPSRCYYVHLQTSDPDLLHCLQQLPDACKLSDASAMRQLFQELAALPVPRSMPQILQVQSLVTRIIQLASRQTARQLPNTSLRPNHRAILLETESYIRSHLSRDLSLAHLSGRVRFSPSRFHNIFTAWFGKTPHEFVMHCRIEEAKAALRSDRSGLIEIASDCGFSSQSHFSAQFKKATGQTPLQYRNAKLSRLEP